jgi:hypothetical protein
MITSVDIIKYTFFGIQFLLFLIALIGNGLVIYAVFSDEKLKKVTGYKLIANISIADLFSCVVIPAKIFRVRIPNVIIL